MNIFFDLDGTLVDNRMRMYRLFCDLTQQNEISFDQYWMLKRFMINQYDILTVLLDYTDEQAKAFHTTWLSTVESPDYLQLDELFDQTESVLETCLQNGYELHLITARQSEKATIRQLMNLNIHHYFTSCIIASPPRSKVKALLEAGLSFGEHDWLIGDTMEDMTAASALHIRSAAVLSGSTGMTVLQEANPDIMLRDISEFPAHISLHSLAKSV
jgi:phosphoglycolate phosphatase